ncbi:sensor histidine kinase [Sphingobacterium sp. HJSM2_6]|uniref:sensor histidine kinase n=1 Tax=Sphingobacterium sp. HJSM2_6 TaxID=3366264 RepID=UPI003BEB088D
MNVFFKIAYILKKYYLKIRNLGITQDVTFLEKKEIQLTNSITLACILSIGIYGIFNRLNYPQIALINFISLGLFLIVFWFNSKMKHHAAKYTLLLALFLILAIVNFGSPNSTEYYLFCLLTISLMMFSERWIVILISISVSLAILIPKFFSIKISFFESLNPERLLINSTLGILGLIGLILYLQSIQRQYQREIEKQNNRFKYLNNDLKHLFAVIAHDIHSPLKSSSSMMNMVINEEISDQDKDASLKLVNKQLNSLKDNLDNLLNWSRQNMEGLLAQPESTSMKKLVDEVLISMEDRYAEKKIKIDYSIPDHLILYVDPIQITIIIRNLLDNALKFSKPDGIVKIQAEQDHNQAILNISDNGIGMPNELLKRIFKRIQVPSFGTLGERGTGLGLVLVQKLVKANQGSITVYSLQNSGSKFVLKFPIDKSAKFNPVLFSK